MHLEDITAIGWVHTLTIIPALLAGALNLVAEKGTARHRFIGRVYVWSMIVSNLSAFGVYHFDIARYWPFTAGRTSSASSTGWPSSRQRSS